MVTAHPVHALFLITDINMDFAETKYSFDNLVCNKDNIYDYSEANRIMEDYVLSAGNMTQKGCQNFVGLFAYLAPKSTEISFYPLEVILNRRYCCLSEQRDFFDNIQNPAQNVDVSFLGQTLQSIGTACRYNTPVSENFVKNFETFIERQITYKDFRAEDIQTLNRFFDNTQCSNPTIERLYASMPLKIIQMQNTKIDKEVTALNEWAFAFKSDDLLKKLSFRSTYINLLYERLVRERSIGQILPESNFNNHRLEINKKIKELTGTFDKKGQKICRRYAINKIYKAQSAADNFKLDCIKSALEHYDKLPSYAFCKEIICAADGGAKNRHVQIPCKTLAWEH